MPSSARRIAANRANARKSTGPTSLSGKARAALNAFKHGLATNRIIVQGEEAAEFEQLRASYLEHYLPVGPEQIALFDDMFSSFWRMRRAQHLEQALFGIVMTEQEWWRQSWAAIDRRHTEDEGKGKGDKRPEVDLDQGLNRAAKDFKGESAVFQTLSQYEARLSRQYLRYRKELRTLQAAPTETQKQPAPVGRVGNPRPVGSTGQAPPAPPPVRPQFEGKPPAPAPNPSPNPNTTDNIRVIGFVPPKTGNSVPVVTPKAKNSLPKPRRRRR
jgi:hypothetical protein